jgi:hypothetical protein
MKDFIPYEYALELNELGFDEPCFKGYTEEYKTLISFSNTRTNSSVKNTLQTKPFTAPLYQQAFRWFREKYNLASHIATYWQHDWNNYSYQYYFVEDKIEWNGIEHYKTYEEAELACLIKLIEIVKNGKSK